MPHMFKGLYVCIQNGSSPLGKLVFINNNPGLENILWPYSNISDDSNQFCLQKHQESPEICLQKSIK